MAAQRDQMAPAVRPVALSRRLSQCAVRVLPAGDRAEYEELFRSELADLVAQECGWSEQVRHALRVLAHTPLLRYELRTPRRERA